MSTVTNTEAPSERYAGVVAGPNWTADPRAVALLASCAANPPKLVRHSKVYALTRDDWSEYEGRRVDQLKALQLELYDAAMARRGPNDEQPVEVIYPTVQDAVGLAVAGGIVRELAA